ncbi:MAG: hypothetical protein Ct9H300mP28_25180 [Pseudomonadota bacterium]|nr:MAG: hypothetical protein Ct9H300mP28_25180 [Pseudomonadota bacterium]
MEVYVQDAPRANEIVFGLVMQQADVYILELGGASDQISENDGLR